MEFGMALKYSATRYKQKAKLFFSLPDHQLAENVSLIFDFYERTKKR